MAFLPLPSTKMPLLVDEPPSCPLPSACPGGTGDPLLPCRTRPLLRRHPLAGGGMSPHAVPPRLTPLPSTKTPFLVDEWPFCLCHPPKRLFWWMNRLSEKITMPNYRRWRRKCQSTIPTVTLTLRECLVPHWGISNDRSEASTTSWPTPSTSLPKTMA